MKPAGRDVEAWSIAPDASTLATVENNRGYAVLRVGPIDGERPGGCSGLPSRRRQRSGLVAGRLRWRSVRRRRRNRRRSGCGGMARRECVAAGAAIPRASWISSWWRGRASTAHVFPAGLPCRAARSRPVVIPLSSGCMAGRWARRGRTSAPTSRCCSRRGSPFCCRMCAAVPATAAAYTESDDVERRLDSVTDLAHGRHWLAAHPAIDGERIGIMGQSYGGFMVMSAITEHPELWRAAVNYYGIADFVTLLAGTGPWRRNHRAAEYGDPEHDAELFARISPIHRVDRIRAPVLIAHGTRDPRVPIGESEQFVKALQERQKKVACTKLSNTPAMDSSARTTAPHLPRSRRVLRREPVNIHLAHRVGEVAARSAAGEGVAMIAAPSPGAPRRPLPRSGRGVLFLPWSQQDVPSYPQPPRADHGPQRRGRCQSSAGDAGRPRHTACRRQRGGCVGRDIADAWRGRAWHVRSRRRRLLSGLYGT